MGSKKKPFSPHYKKLTEVAWKVIHIAITDLFCHLCHKNDDADVFPARYKKTLPSCDRDLLSVLLRRGELLSEGFFSTCCHKSGFCLQQQQTLLLLIAQSVLPASNSYSEGEKPKI